MTFLGFENIEDENVLKLNHMIIKFIDKVT